MRKPEPALCAQLAWQIAGQYRLFKNCSTPWGWSVVFTMSGTGASLWNKLRGGAYLVDRACCGRSWCNSLLWYCTWWWRLHGEGYKWCYCPCVQLHYWCNLITIMVQQELWTCLGSRKRDACLQHSRSQSLGHSCSNCWLLSFICLASLSIMYRSIVLFLLLAYLLSIKFRKFCLYELISYFWWFTMRQLCWNLCSGQVQNYAIDDLSWSQSMKCLLLFMTASLRHEEIFLMPGTG